MQIGKEEIKLSFFTDDLAVYAESLKKSATTTKTFQELLHQGIIARLQDSRVINKSQPLSYTPATKNWNLKLKTQHYLY